MASKNMYICRKNSNDQAFSSKKSIELSDDQTSSHDLFMSMKADVWIVVSIQGKIIGDQREPETLLFHLGKSIAPAIHTLGLLGEGSFLNYVSIRPVGFGAGYGWLKVKAVMHSLEPEEAAASSTPGNQTNLPLVTSLLSAAHTPSV